jgi:hypothetical protein
MHRVPPQDSPGGVTARNFRASVPDFPVAETAFCRPKRQRHTNGNKLLRQRTGSGSAYFTSSA